MTRFISMRPWFRFSVLGLLVLVTIAAGAAGWIAYHLRWIRQREEVLARGDLMIPIVCLVPEEPPAAPPWPLGWFGATPARSRELYLPFGASEEEVARVQRLFPEAQVGRP